MFTYLDFSDLSWSIFEIPVTITIKKYKYDFHKIKTYEYKSSIPSRKVNFRGSPDYQQYKYNPKCMYYEVHLAVVCVSCCCEAVQGSNILEWRPRGDCSLSADLLAVKKTSIKSSTLSEVSCKESKIQTYKNILTQCTYSAWRVVYGHTENLYAEWGGKIS